MKILQELLNINSRIMLEREGERYYTEHEIEKLSAPSEHNTNTICKVGKVVFDQINGLGQTPYNTDIFYFGFIAMMTPKNFLKLAASGGRQREEAGRDLQKEIEKGRSIASPFLEIPGRDVKDRTEFIRVHGHEGRGRCNAMVEMGMGSKLIPVHILTNPIRARSLVQEDIEHIAKSFTSESNGELVTNVFKTYFLDHENYTIK